MSGPVTPECDAVHAEKHRGENESHREAMNRVASALQDDHEHYQAFRRILLGMFFLPAGRVQAAMGSLKNITPYNCFVSPAIEDSFVSGLNSIMDCAKQSAATMRQGGGIGYDFSTLRPKGDLIVGVGAATDGPMAFAPIFDAICKATSSAGNRRGAQMLVMRVDHPDIEEFVRAKQNQDKLTGFNLSIAITDEFMDCLKNEKPFQLKFGGKVYREIDPVVLWELIMRSNYDWAEPGVLFIDTINRMNNLWYCETIAATNPCVPGETPILTRTGWRPIEDCVGEGVEVWNGKKWSLVHPQPTGRNQPMVNVTLSNGQELTCTTAHGFYLVNGDKVEAAELLVGDELLEMDWPIVEGGQDYELAYTQGCFAGDGWYASRGRPYISFKRKDKKALEPYIHHVNAYDTKTNYRYLYLKDKIQHDKYFVPIDNTWSIKSRLDWLAGLLDTDGTAIWSHNRDGNKCSCVLSISSVNKKFMDDVCLMLRSLGVTTNRDIDTRQNEWSKSKACYRLGIKSSNVKKLQELGLSTQRIKLEENNPRSNNKVKLLIENVTSSGIADVVYCFTEPLKHRGCFNGILTSQCGEQPLPPYGACLLGSANLVKYLTKDEYGNTYVDQEALAADIPCIVRSMDNVVDRARYPLPQQEREAKDKRRLGLGMTGVANALEACGLVYGSKEFLSHWKEIGDRFTRECYLASVELAKEKGSFPLFDAEKYLQSEFIKSLDEDVQELIGKYGIRNSHLTSIAPTGSISFGADNISSAIEPVFAYKAQRMLKQRSGDIIVEADDYGVKFLGVNGKVAADVTPEEHVAVLTTTQSFIDSAVSKTCNVPHDIEWEAYKNIYIHAYEEGAKGCTTYRDGCLRSGILKAVTEGEIEADGVCLIDPLTNERSCE